MVAPLTEIVFSTPLFFTNESSLTKLQHGHSPQDHVGRLFHHLCCPLPQRTLWCPFAVQVSLLCLEAPYEILPDQIGDKQHPIFFFTNRCVSQYYYNADVVGRRSWEFFPLPGNLIITTQEVIEFNLPCHILGNVGLSGNRTVQVPMIYSTSFQEGVGEQKGT